MYSNLFSPESIEELTAALQTQFLPRHLGDLFMSRSSPRRFATVLSGLPLGVLLVAGEKNGVLPLPPLADERAERCHQPAALSSFLILMIMVFPLSRLIIGTTVGDRDHRSACRRGLSFVARLVESSLRELDANIIEAAQSMGATPMQIICKVMIPESVPSLLQTSPSRSRPFSATRL